MNKLTEDQARKLCEGFPKRMEKAIEETRPSREHILKLQKAVKSRD